MSEPLSPIKLSDLDENVLDQFEARCQEAVEPVEQFLKSLDHEAQPMLLLELALLEMEFRYKAGDFVRADEYFSRFPALIGSPELMVRLITEEYRLMQAQVGPKIEDYLHRFPRLRMSLLAAMHNLNGPLSLTSKHQPPTSQPMRLGHYEIIEQVGQGSFGTVYKAKDQHLGRTVAVKRLRLDGKQTSQLSSVLNEAKNTAVLTHPNIVQLFEVAITDDHDFLIVCQFIEGADLAEIIRQSAISCNEAAAWIWAIAQALHSAHCAGILHLDIKPSNILLDRHRKVWLADFGLSHSRPELESQATDTDPIGTLAYMSPEQAGIQCDPIDVRSDVYSLGVVLFELLTGRLPFQGNRLSLLEQLRSADPPSPREFRREIDRDLEQICLKAVNRSPRQRYASAKAMADDLERYLSGKPTHARPLSSTAKAARWCWRNPQMASLAALVLVACSVGAAGIGLQWREALHQEQLAEHGAASLFNALSTIVQISSVNALRAPDSREQMQAMLIVAKENYEQALRSNPVIQSKPHQTARALLGLGTVFNQLGDYDRAVEIFDEADRCLHDHVSTAERQSLVTEITLGKATSYRRSGDKRRALPLYYSVLKQVANSASTEVNCVKRTAEIAWYIAEAELSCKNFETASTMASMAYDRWSDCQLKYLPQGDTECITGKAKSKYLMATCDFELGRFNNALEGFDQASVDLEKLTQQFPSALNYRRDLAASYHNQARTLHQLGDNDSSAERYRLAIEIRRNLVEMAPENFVFVSELQGSEANLNLLANPP